MKTENPAQNDGAFNQLLGEWKVESSLPPRFGAEVWRRVARNETPQPNTLSLLRDWIVRTFSRPAFAVGYTTILLLAGLGAGLWQSHAAASRTHQALSARYVQSVDPYHHAQP